jgi:hypothetical protein
MPIASRSTNVGAKPTGLGQLSGDGAYAHGWNVAGPRADGGEQESLPAEQRELGNNLAEREIESAWPGKAAIVRFFSSRLSPLLTRHRRPCWSGLFGNGPTEKSVIAFLAAKRSHENHGQKTRFKDAFGLRSMDSLTPTVWAIN